MVRDGILKLYINWSISPAALVTAVGVPNIDRTDKTRWLESFVHPTCNASHLVVHLPWRAPENQFADCVSRDLDILEGSENVYLLISQNDTRPCGILNGEPRFTTLNT